MTGIGMDFGDGRYSGGWQSRTDLSEMHQCSVSNIWHLLMVINGCASSDRSLGLMLMWVHLGLSYVMSSYVFITSCVCMMHNVCVMLGSSLLFLAFVIY